jgi:DNA-binding SARP family transcriptional activator
MVVDFVDALVARQSPRPTAVLRLFGGPVVANGRTRREIPEGGQRLLVFVALHRGRLERRYVANTLWPIGDDGRAGGNLRSALWRLNRAGIDVLAVDKHSLEVRDDVLVDVRLVGEWANRLIGGAPPEEDLVVLPSGIDALDLLPGWYDDWVLMERERVRQRMLHSLDALSRCLVRAGRWAEGVEAAMVAVAAEPLRESAQRALLEAHISEGNWVEGRRAFNAYRSLLRRELGVEPDPALFALLRGGTVTTRTEADVGLRRPMGPQQAAVPAARRRAAARQPG